MQFPHGQTVQRDRRPLIPDRYNPDGVVPGSWDDATTVPLEGAFVASSSSIATTDATRTQTITDKSLYLTDPAADVLPGDRVRVGASTYLVETRPEADVNPFTGWQPITEIPLTEVTG